MTKEFRLDPDEVNRRKAFLEFSDKDVALLKNLHERMNCGSDAFVDDFYKHLLSFQELHGLLDDEATLARLKRTQSVYFCQLTAGNYDEAYIQNRLRVGVAHERVGLDPKWYIGAYCKYLSLMLPRIMSGRGEPDADLVETVMALLKILFFDMGIAIDTYINAKQQTIQKKTTQISALNQIAVAISSALGWQELLERIMKSGIALTGSKAACLAFYDENKQSFGEWHTHGLSDYFVEHMLFRPGGLASKALNTGRYILSNDQPGSEYKLSELVRQEGLRCFLCLPFVSHTHSLGVLYLYRDDRDTFLQEEIELLGTFAHLAAIAAENTQLRTSAMRLATTDALTGLLNRRALEDVLKTERLRAQRYGRDISLMILDIDHFKNINDTHGHISGDAVLKILASVLLRQMRDIDKVARFGGEEFVIILPETGEAGAGIAAERVRNAVAATAFILPDGHEINMTVSIGIACFSSGAGVLETVLEQADRALYQAKNSGRNRVCLHKDLM
jgi:diguanylate cyclase (GGDEF)-like protein